MQKDIFHSTITSDNNSKIFKIISLISFFVLISSIVAGYFVNNSWLVLLPVAIPIIFLPFINLRFFYALFLLILALSIDLQFDTLSMNLPAEPIMIGMLLLSLILIVLNKEYLQIFKKNNVIINIILLQLFWLMISVLFATYHGIAIKFLLSKLWFLASFVFLPLLIIRKPADIITVAKIFFIPIFIHTFFVLGWHAVLKFGYQESNQVVFPFYKNHVDYGSMLSILFSVFFTLTIYYWKHLPTRILLMGILLYLSVALVAASSRGAMLAAIFCIGVYFALKYKKAHWVFPAFYTFVIAIVFFFAYNKNYINFRPDMHKNASQETLLETIVGTFTGKDMSSMERFYRWIASIRMTEEHPVVGVGPNNWYYHYKPYAVTSFRTWVSRNPEKSTTHNYFLLMLTEQGIPAMLLYAGLILVIFSKGQRLYFRLTDQKEKHIVMAALLAISTVFVNNFFSEFLETHKIGGVFYLSIAVIIFMDRWSKKNDGKLTQVNNETIV